MERVVVVPDREDVPLHDVANLRAEHGCVPDEGAAVDRLEVQLLAEVDDELAVRRLLIPPEDRDRAVHAARDRVGHRLRVIVVRPDARCVLAGLEPVRVLVARLHVPTAGREARDVRAVGAEAVVHTVEVHRVRPFELVVEVLEVDDDLVAHARAKQRPRDAVVVGSRVRLVRDHPLPVAGVAPVHDRREPRLVLREALALDRVAPVRDDVPAHRNGRDPVLAHRSPLTSGVGGHEGDDTQEGQERTERSQPSDDALSHLVTRMTAAMSGPWSMQMKLYLPAFANVTLTALGGGPGIPSASGVA